MAISLTGDFIGTRNLLCLIMFLKSMYLVFSENQEMDNYVLLHIIFSANDKLRFFFFIYIGVHEL